MNAVLADEMCHESSEPIVRTLAEIMATDVSGEVLLHNTMRFDIQMAWIQPILDDGDVTKEDLAAAIRNAIIDAVEQTLGVGLDGTPIPGGASVTPVPRSVMLHRETIHFDLS